MGKPEWRLPGVIESLSNDEERLRLRSITEVCRRSWDRGIKPFSVKASFSSNVGRSKGVFFLTDESVLSHISISSETPWEKTLDNRGKLMGSSSNGGVFICTVRSGTSQSIRGFGEDGSLISSIDFCSEVVSIDPDSGYSVLYDGTKRIALMDGAGRSLGIYGVHGLRPGSVSYCHCEGLIVYAALAGDLRAIAVDREGRQVWTRVLCDQNSGSDLKTTDEVKVSWDPATGHSLYFWSNHLRVLDSDGRILLNADTATSIEGCSLSGPARLIAICCTDGSVLLMDFYGNVVWSTYTPALLDATLDHDGRYLAISDSRGYVILQLSLTSTVNRFQWLETFTGDVRGDELTGSRRVGIPMELVWRAEIRERVDRLALAESSIAVSSSKAEELSILDRKGRRLNTHSVGHIRCIIMFPALKGYAAGIGNRWINFYSEDGRLLWRRLGKGPVTDLHASGDGTLLVTGSGPTGEVAVYTGAGTRLWRKSLDSGRLELLKFIGSRFIAVSGGNGEIDYLSLKGDLLWRIKALGELVCHASCSSNEFLYTADSSGLVNCLSPFGITEFSVYLGAKVRHLQPVGDGSIIAAGSSTVWFIDKTGNVMWRAETEESISSLAVDRISNLVFVGIRSLDKPASSSYDRILTLNLKGEELGSYRISGWVCQLQYDRYNRSLVVGSGDKGVYLLSIAGPGRFGKLEIKG